MATEENDDNEKEDNQRELKISSRIILESKSTLSVSLLEIAGEQMSLMLEIFLALTKKIFKIHMKTTVNIIMILTMETMIMPELKNSTIMGKMVATQLF